MFQRIRQGDKIFLARAITWMESSNAQYREKALNLISLCDEIPSDTVRIAVTGPPGVGKSTLIEVIGSLLIEKGHRVAVLAVDPSSNESHGSILGDKTRMSQLSMHPAAYVRPSPSGLELGGVNQGTRESILICEAAGYDIIFVETVGVGQSEIEVKNMTDLFLLLLNPGGGDDLQGIKKGIMEAADLIAITKFDTNLAEAGREAYNHIRRSLQVLKTGKNEGPDVLNVSATEHHNLDKLISLIFSRAEQMKNSGQWDHKRNNQKLAWFRLGLLRRLMETIQEDLTVRQMIDDFPQSGDHVTTPIPVLIEHKLNILKDRFRLK